MEDLIRKIIGWERFNGTPYLRLQLAKPRIAPVWPGDPSIEKPEAQLRRLTDRVMTREDIDDVLTHPACAAAQELSAADLGLLAQALKHYPGAEPAQPQRGPVTARRWPILAAE